jgi:hypothetical protein
MRAAPALVALVALAACGSPPPPEGNVLWFAPGGSEQSYILSQDKPNPY